MLIPARVKEPAYSILDYLAVFVRLWHHKKHAPTPSPPQVKANRLDPELLSKQVGFGPGHVKGVFVVAYVLIKHQTLVPLPQRI